MVRTTCRKDDLGNNALGLMPEWNASFPRCNKCYTILKKLRPSPAPSYTPHSPTERQGINVTPHANRIWRTRNRFGRPGEYRRHHPMQKSRLRRRHCGQGLVRRKDQPQRCAGTGPKLILKWLLILDLYKLTSYNASVRGEGKHQKPCRCAGGAKATIQHRQWKVL